MGILNKLSDAVGNDDGGSFRYECRACYHQFESTTETLSDVVCPECGDHNVRNAKTL